MAILTNSTVEHIRVLYASGLYHKADLAVRFSSYMESPEDILKVLDYNIFTDVREDLRLKIYGMAYVFDIADNYHDTLRLGAMREFDGIIDKGSKAPAEFQNIRDKANKDLNTKLTFINKEFGLAFTLYDIKSRIYRNL